MNNFDNYILSTRGCIIPDTEEAQCCLPTTTNSLHCFAWAEDIKTSFSTKNLVEIRFKNNRKDIFYNHEELFLKTGDIVAVEAPTGHDIGIVNLIGEEIFWQLKKQENPEYFPKIYRKVKPVDIEKWKKAVEREIIVLTRTKEIIEDLSLKMKLGDVEFQGDNSKATFYYTADERVDFRELIKILASEFKIRIEMRQIGARQESSKIGGIGTCGLELCCVKWKRKFDSVTTNSARFQELSLNPSKLAGQCGKLKCCLNYEVNAYIEARKGFPETSITLKTKEGNAYFQKSDVFKKILWYSFDPENSVNITPLTIERVDEIIEINKKGEIPDTLLQNNLELADLISNKHNIQITKEEIDKSKEDANLKKIANKNNKKRNQRQYRNKKRKNQNPKNEK
ncbi:MAG: hypothetical protein JXR68_00375 [Bacteroidales bacterium]|nr:hypothetical protein [Bacteroidales bacterium]